MTNAITVTGQSMPLQDMERLAKAITASQLFGIKTPEQALALMAICQADGIHPAKAAQMYHIIQGRAALKSDAMLARFQQAGGKVQWITATDKECSAEFSHAQGGTLKVTWTLDDAKRAKLTGKENWTTYPRQMLRARVISEGVRAVYPGVTTGFYTPEEVADFTNASSAELKQVESAVQSDAGDAEHSAKREKVATVTGEIKERKPDWSEDQLKRLGALRAEALPLDPKAEAEMVQTWKRMKYDDPEDTIAAMEKVLRQWQDIADQANTNAGAIQ